MSGDNTKQFWIEHYSAGHERRCVDALSIFYKEKSNKSNLMIYKTDSSSLSIDLQKTKKGFQRFGEQV